MTFKKNLLVVIIATIFISVAMYLSGTARDVAVNGLFIWVAGSIATLAIEDLFRKGASESDKITLPYIFGIALVAAGVIAFLGTLGTSTMMEFCAYLGVAVFFGILGSIVFYVPYKASVLDAEGRYERIWAKAKKSVNRKKTPEAKVEVLAKVLRYRLVGDSLDGDLDLDRPLAFYEGAYLTLNEITDKLPIIDGEVDEDSAEFDIMSKAEAYLKNLTQEVE